jgi:energy-coupling factor transporter transmembrane protein EcfT
METTKPSRRADWLIFLLSTAVMIFMLIYVNEWFWLAMPFSFTYLAKALDVL